MAKEGGFGGFFRETLDFFKLLMVNNNKEWFEEHRNDYEKYVLAPSREFVMALGQRLGEIVPGLNADPRVNKSLFRLYRDTRFSQDKTPYKNHMGLWFWQGSRPRMECSGFYFHLEPDNMMLGGGIYKFPKDMIDSYRRAVVHPKQGPALTRAIADVEKQGLTTGGVHYKRVPRGYDPGHKNAGLLLHDGLYVGLDLGLPDQIFRADLVDFCVEYYRLMIPVHKWLSALTGGNPF